MIQNRMTRMFKKYQVFIEFYGSGQKWNIQKTLIKKNINKLAQSELQNQSTQWKPRTDWLSR